MIDIKICNKSKESYDFVSKYLEVISYESYITNEKLYQICAYDRFNLVGCSIFRLFEGRIHLNYTVVSEPYRRMGINSQLINKMISIGKLNKCDLITANIRASNIASIESLKSIGFKINNNILRDIIMTEKKK